jgi:hypothetical protein
MLRVQLMNYILRIMTIFLLLNINNNVFAIETINKIKKESKNIFKTITRKSLTKKELLQFLAEYVIIIDDKKGNGIVTYYFEDVIYKRYKNLELISQDKWTISKLGSLKILDNGKKSTWKIQPAEKNIINIKHKIASIGNMYNFNYEDKTDYYLKLEEKKINSKKN